MSPTFLVHLAMSPQTGPEPREQGIFNQAKIAFLDGWGDVPYRNLECFSHRLMPAISVQGWWWGTCIEYSITILMGCCPSTSWWTCTFSWEELLAVLMIMGANILGTRARYPGTPGQRNTRRQDFYLSSSWFLSFFQYRQVPRIGSSLPVV